MVGRRKDVVERAMRVVVVAELMVVGRGVCAVFLVVMMVKHRVVLLEVVVGRRGYRFPCNMSSKVAK